MDPYVVIYPLSRQEARHRVIINRHYQARLTDRFRRLTAEQKSDAWLAYCQDGGVEEFEAFKNLRSRVRDLEAPVSETAVEQFMAGKEVIESLWS